MQFGLNEKSPHLWNNMPNYDFYNSKTDEVEEHFMSFTKLDEFKEQNPHLQQRILGAPMTVGGVGDRVKTDDGFKEVLSNVGKAYPGSTVDKRYNGVGVKESQTRAIAKKHIDLQSKKK